MAKIFENFDEFKKSLDEFSSEQSEAEERAYPMTMEAFEASLEPILAVIGGGRVRASEALVPDKSVDDSSQEESELMQRKLDNVQVREALAARIKVTREDKVTPEMMSKLGAPGLEDFSPLMETANIAADSYAEVMEAILAEDDPDFCTVAVLEAYFLKCYQEIPKRAGFDEMNLFAFSFGFASLRNNVYALLRVPRPEKSSLMRLMAEKTMTSLQGDGASVNLDQVKDLFDDLRAAMYLKKSDLMWTDMLLPAIARGVVAHQIHLGNLTTISDDTEQQAVYVDNRFAVFKNKCFRSKVYLRQISTIEYLSFDQRWSQLQNKLEKSFDEEATSVVGHCVSLSFGVLTGVLDRVFVAPECREKLKSIREGQMPVQLGRIDNDFMSLYESIIEKAKELQEANNLSSGVLLTNIINELMPQVVRRMIEPYIDIEEIDGVVAEAMKLMPVEPLMIRYNDMCHPGVNPMKDLKLNHVLTCSLSLAFSLSGNNAPLLSDINGLKDLMVRNDSMKKDRERVDMGLASEYSVEQLAEEDYRRFQERIDACVCPLVGLPGNGVVYQCLNALPKVVINFASRVLYDALAQHPDKFGPIIDRLTEFYQGKKKLSILALTESLMSFNEGAVKFLKDESQHKRFRVFHHGRFRRGGFARHLAVNMREVIVDYLGAFLGKDVVDQCRVNLEALIGNIRTSDISKYFRFGKDDLFLPEMASAIEDSLTVFVKSVFQEFLRDDEMIFISDHEVGTTMMDSGRWFREDERLDLSRKNFDGLGEDPSFLEEDETGDIMFKGAHYGALRIGRSDWSFKITECLLQKIEQELEEKVDDEKRAMSIKVMVVAGMYRFVDVFGKFVSLIVNSQEKDWSNNSIKNIVNDWRKKKKNIYLSGVDTTLVNFFSKSIDFFVAHPELDFREIYQVIDQYINHCLSDIMPEIWGEVFVPIGGSDTNKGKEIVKHFLQEMNCDQFLKDSMVTYLGQKFAEPERLVIDDVKLASHLFLMVLAHDFDGLERMYLLDAFRVCLSNNNYMQAVERFEEERTRVLTLMASVPGGDLFQVNSEVSEKAGMSMTAIMVIMENFLENKITPERRPLARSIVCKADEIFLQKLTEVIDAVWEDPNSFPKELREKLVSLGNKQRTLSLLTVSQTRVRFLMSCLVIVESGFMIDTKSEEGLARPILETIRTIGLVDYLDDFFNKIFAA